MNFKRKKRAQLLMISLLVALSGCIKSDKPKDTLAPTTLNTKSVQEVQKVLEKEDSNSSFYIDGEASAKVINRVTSFDGNSKDVRALDYQFEVCLGEYASNRRLRNFKFKVESSTGETPLFSKEILTDQRGCLIWTEQIAFDIAKPSPRPIVFMRKIGTSKKTSRQGEISFFFQLFPWAEILGSQEHPVFYHLRGEERFEYSTQIQNLFSQSYNPKEELKASEGEEGRLFVRKVGYDLTAFPFSLVKKDLQPQKNEILRNPEAAHKENNFVMFPDTPEKDGLADLDFLRQQKQILPYRDLVADKQSAFDGIKVDLVLKINLAQSYEGFNGSLPRDLREGRFKVLPYIYATDYNSTGDRVLLNPEMGALESVIDIKGDLNLLYSGVLPYAPTSGRVELALQIIPMDNNAAKYKTVEEIFTIGNYDDLIGDKSRLWENPKQFNEDFNFVEYAKGSSGYEDAVKNSSLTKAEPYNYSLAKVKHKTIDPGETANRRTVIYNVNTCVNAFSFHSKVLQGQEFEVVSRHFKKPEAERADEIAEESNVEADLLSGTDYKDINLFKNQEGDKIITDSKGCLNFIDKISHKFYQTERLVRRKYFIRAKNDPQNFTKELVLYLNPWDEKFGTLGTDARAVSRTFLRELNNRKKIVPRFFIKDFGYETLRFRYEIDKNMNLDVKKTVLLRMRPLVLRYSNVLQGINSIHDLRDGIYLLKVAYQKDYLDPAAQGVTISSGVVKDQKTGEIKRNLGPKLTVKDQNGRVLKTDLEAEKNKAYAVQNNKDLDGSEDVIPPYDPSRKTSISIVKKLVRVNAGNIVTPVEFGVDDLRLLRIRAQFFVQIEPVNQTRLQIVNMASQRIEKALNLKKGEPSEIAKLPIEEQHRIIKLKMKALDTLASAIPDNLEYSVKDPSELEAVFKKPEVVKAFSPFISGGELGSVENMLGLENTEKELLQTNILEALKKEKDFVQKVQNLNQQIKQDNLPAPGTQHFIEHRVNGQNKKLYTEIHYENSKSFYNMCGENYKGYDQCVADHRKDDPNFDAQLCKCFDNVSKDYQVQSNKYGDFLDALEKENKDLKNTRAVLKKVRSLSDDFFKGLSSKEALIELLLNDFTLAQAESDVSDLDLLRDKVIEGVDIKARTFVGPLTFLNNSNSGSLRPTDNLDEAYCVTDDCNAFGSDPLNKYGAIQNFDYERSPYHGSIAHFADFSVDDFIKGKEVEIGNTTKQIPGYLNFKEEKSKIASVKALLSNFVEELNLQYVSLKDKKLKKVSCPNPLMVDFKTGKCLADYEDRHLNKESLVSDVKEYAKSFKFAQRIERGQKFQDLDPIFDLASLGKIVKRDHGGQSCQKKVVPASYAEFEKEDYAKLCSMMTFGVFTKNYFNLIDDFKSNAKDKSLDIKEQTLAIRFNAAMRGYGLDYKGDRVLNAKLRRDIEGVYRSCLEYAAKGKNNEPLDIERKYKIKETGRYYYLGGKSLNINLSQTIGISHKKDSNKVHKADPSFITKFLPPVFSAYGYTYGSGEGVSANAGTNVSQGTFLVMQNAEFDIELKKYEQCLVVRWSDGFLKKKADVFYENTLASHVKRSKLRFGKDSYVDHVRKGLTEGVMVCSGDLETEPVAVRETYYYFTQHFTEGDMQDRADIHNHPWLLSLRGVREYETFLALTHSDHEASDADLANKYVQAEELVGMGKLLKSDLSAENLDGTSFEGFDKYKRNGWPLSQLVKTYRKISPTFPGLYTQLPRKAYEVDQWPWKGSQAGDHFGADREAEGSEGLNCYKK